MEILIVTMGFTLLTTSGCDSVTRVVGLILHIPLDSMIHGPPVCKIINPSPCRIPMSFKRKWYKQAAQFPKFIPITE